VTLEGNSGQSVKLIYIASDVTTLYLAVTVASTFLFEDLKLEGTRVVIRIGK
jgi:hypothetical protein